MMPREGVTIVIRKDEGEDPPHHGGAWKVAYADFVTAMMAFFLLMWLINATTEDQRKGLADYFAPTNLFGHSASGSGKPFGGQTPNEFRHHDIDHRLLAGDYRQAADDGQTGSRTTTIRRCWPRPTLPHRMTDAGGIRDAGGGRPDQTRGDLTTLAQIRIDGANDQDGSRSGTAIDDAKGAQSHARGGDYRCGRAGGARSRPRR